VTCLAEHHEAAGYRYRYRQGKWKRDNNFSKHTKEHRMRMILPVPYSPEPRKTSR
jgi:hypothetical protein